MYMASLKDEATEENPEPAAAETAPPAERPAAGAPAVEEKEEVKPAESEDKQASGAPRVNIEVRDGELFMYSADEEALNEVEGLENPTSEVLARWILQRMVLPAGKVLSVSIGENAVTSCTVYAD